MKNSPLSHYVLCIINCAFILLSCSGSGDSFKIRGRLHNFNQGEIFIYSNDGGTSQLDTIKVQDNRFSYETYLSEPATFMLVFPNFSEQVIFGEPGRKASVSGDATRLKEIKVSGTKENRMMTDFRKSTANSSPQEIINEIKSFIEEHPESRICEYLIDKYLIKTEKPDYKTALSLLKQVLKVRPKDVRLLEMKNQLVSLQTIDKGISLPAFSAKDQNGKSVTNDFCKGKIGLIIVWASWCYESDEFIRIAKTLKEDHPDDLSILSISLDASKYNNKQALDRHDVSWQNICDSKMWQSPLVRKLGISDVPDAIIINRNGKIEDFNLPSSQLREKIENLINKK